MAQGVIQSAKEDETILSLTVKQADFGQKTNNFLERNPQF